MAGTDFIWRFTPSRTEPELLEAIFVQREPLLADIVEKVRDGATSGDKHQVLLVGPRGIGKTHLISLLHHRITQDASLAGRVRIAWFLEDETITSFVQLLKRIYELLSESYPDEFPKDWLEDVLDRPPAKILKAIEKELIEKFQDKMLLMFVENLDMIFEGLKDVGQKQWRSFLQTHPFTSIVATSQRLSKDLGKRDQPFFGFFSTIHLKPLPAPDAVHLLDRIAHQCKQADVVEYLSTPEGRSRVRALHHIAGGNHRIYIVLSGFITRDSLDELTGPFEKMADELTPYYQERMRWLSLQQRQIIEYFCSREDPCTPKQIARHLLATENTISSQLKKLRELGYVLGNSRGRDSLYELAEPLMRLASEVKEKRRKPLRLLVTFLRIWYRPEVLPELLEKAGTSSLRDHIQAAISQSQSSPDPRLRVLEEEIEKAKQENRLEDLLQILDERVHTRGSAKDWFDLAYYHDKFKDFEAAVRCLDRALEIDPRYAYAWNGKGVSLHRLGRQEEAVDCYNRALEIDPRDIVAWNNKGITLSEFGRQEEALACYDRALEIDSRYSYAWYNKGHKLYRIGRQEEALTCCDRALEIDSHYSYAWIIKGLSLGDLGRNEEALACYDRALEIGPCDAIAWNNKGRVLERLGRDGEAVECYDHALKIDPSYSYSWNNKGRAFNQLGRYEAARECYERAFEADPAQAFWVFDRCEPSFALRLWKEGFELLGEAFKQRSRDTRHNAQAFINLVRKLSEGLQELRQNIGSLIAIYREEKVLPYLGDSLVRSLRDLKAERVARESLKAWRDLWLELGAYLDELEIPLRIFRVGIEYLIRGDEKAMLDLVSVERSVLRQALGLDSPEDVE